MRRFRGRIASVWIAATILLAVAAVRRARADTPVNPCPGCSQAPLSLPAQVGEKIFADKSLSASGQLACATCHDPAHAYSSPNNLAVQLGGPTMSSPGTRAVPSLRYKEFTTPYADVAPNPDGVSTPGPGGGFTWDGRADTLADQAQIPLLASNEMANASPADVVSKLQSAAYADLFRTAFGSDVFSSPSDAFQDALNALQAYQLEDNDFHPYTSRFDLNADNKIGGTLTPSEQRGFEVFMDPSRGNCFACHFSGPGNNGSSAMFTDFTYEAIGVPRSAAIPANADRGHFDLGICSRADHPLPDSAQFCGMFKVPTLRNVAIRKVFFHNGVFTSLREVLNFYNTRDTQPQLWYPIVDGVVQKFDDLPAQYQTNLDTQVPLDGRAAGSQPPMSAQDLDDLEAFLGTLTDADVVNQITSTPAVPALGTDASATRMLVMTLLAAGVLSVGRLTASNRAGARRFEERAKTARRRAA
ncbi:MAG TPA: cytochrome c peroxidase [Polyangia bacterium]|jgi:cytochrome c peroxidase|nr:cytochrome c peroxidase [Polyangia bacterium]